MNASIAHHSLEIWSPRRATSLNEARRRTAVVHLLRLAFTVGAVVSAGLLIGTMVRQALEASKTTLSAPATSVTILNPRFEGRDANDLPFVVTADTARRRPNDSSVIDLVHPRMDDEIDGTIVAIEGVYNREEQLLDLVGDVVMTEAGGYTFRTERARAYIRENRVVGQTPLVGEGPNGQIRADAYEVLDDGRRLILTGNIWSQFDAAKE